MKEDIRENSKKYGVWILILLFGVIGISLCFNNNIWTDEAFTMQLIRSNLPDIIYGTAIDVHPPLYYIIAKAARVIFGEGLFVQKVTTIVPVIILMIFSFFKVTRLFGSKANLIFTSFLIAFPAMLEYAVQVRMYTWALLFVTICGITAYDLYQNPTKSQWILFMVSGLAAAYTHYFALLSVAIIYGYFLLALLISKKKQVKNWFIMLFLTIALYSPWMFVWLGQIKKVVKGYHIPEITIKTVLSYFDWALSTQTPYSTVMYEGLLLFSIVLTITAIVWHKAPVDIYALLAISIPILTMIIGVIVSVLITPIFNSRYIFPAIGLLLLGFSISMRNMKMRSLVLLLCFFSFSSIVQYQGIYKTEYLSTKVIETEDFFEQNIKPEDLVVYNFTGFGFIYEYYLPDNELIYLADMDFNREFNTIWYFDTYNYLYLDDSTLDNFNLDKEFVGNFGVEDNEFKIYKITRKQG